jgi:hypothetical protein
VSLAKSVAAMRDNSDVARGRGPMLPPFVELDRQLRREKTGVDPTSLSDTAPGSKTCEQGDVRYWHPRNAFLSLITRPAWNYPARNRVARPA